MIGRGLRRIKVPIKYYLYVSETKVQMLHSQIPRRMRKSIEAEFTANVAVVAARVKKAAELDPTDTIARTAVVSAYLGRTVTTGPVGQPGEYVHDTCRMRYCRVTDYAASIAFFGGSREGIDVGLIGSPDSLVGAARNSDAGHDMLYYTLQFLEAAAARPPHPYRTRPQDDFRRAYEAVFDALPALDLDVEFLAKVVHREFGLVVASPIYVAMA